MHKFFFTFALLFSSSLSAQITGVVMNKEGAPLGGVTVTAFEQESSEEVFRRVTSAAFERKPLSSTKTDERGRFQIRVEEKDVVDLAFARAGFAPFAMAMESRGDAGAIRLDEARLVTGTVLRNGEPLAGAIVRWSRGDAEVIAKTGADGTYSSFDPLKWRASLLVVDGGKPLFRWTPTDFPESKPPFPELRLEPKSIKGVFRTADGKPIPNAAILVDGMPVVVTDPGGAFTSELCWRWNELVASSASQSGVARPSTAALILKAFAPSPLRGQIRAAGKGIAGARIDLWETKRFSGLPSASLLSSADGSFAISSLPPREYRLQISRPGYPPTFTLVTVAPGQTTAKTISLTRGAVITGRVVDENDAPVRVASLEVRATPGIDRENALSGPDGRFVLRDLPANPRSKVRATKSGYPEAESEAVDARSGETRTNVVVTMLRGVEVKGRVIDAQGKPIAGVTVAASFDSQPWFFFEDEDQEFVETDKNGQFTLHLQKATWYFHFKSDGYEVKTLSGRDVDRDVQLEAVVLRKGATITGRVLRKSGTAVPEATVGAGMQFTTTADDGRFVLSSLPIGKTWIFADKRDGGFVRKEIDAPANDVVLELPDTVAIHGRVLDADTNKPIPDFALGIARTTNTPAAKSRYHADDGSFSIDAVPSEGVSIVASASGYPETRKILSNADEAKKPLEILLRRGARVTGRVVDSSGTPLAEARLSIIKRMQSTADRDAVFTDESGAFAFEGVERGPTTINVEKSGFISARKTADVTGTETKLDVELKQGIKLEGTVVDEAGSPVGGASVFAASSGSYAGATTSAKGAFVLEPLAAARASITVNAAGYPEKVVRDVDVAATPSLRVALERGAVLRGRVIGLEGNELTSVTIAVDEEQYERRVAENGTFVIRGVRTGRHVVAAASRSLGRVLNARPVEVNVAANQEAEVELEFSTRIRVSGTIRRDNAPLANGFVSFQPADSEAEGYASAQTDANGAYEVSGLIEGKYVIRIFDSGAQFSTEHDVRGSETFDIRVESTKVAGRIVDSKHQPVKDASITLVPKTPSSNYWTSPVMSDVDGRFVFNTGTGAYNLTVQKAGLATFSRELLLGTEDTSALEVILDSSARSRIRVIDARDGKPVRASVCIFEPAGRCIATQWRPGGEDGITELDASDGTYDIAIWTGLFATKIVRITIPSPETTIALTPGGTLVIHGSLERRSRLTFHDSSGAIFRLLPMSSDPSILVEGEQTFRTFAPGAYTVEAVPIGGGAPKTYRIVVEEGKTTELTLE